MKRLVNRILGLFGVMVVRSATLRRLKAELSALKRQLDDARQRENRLQGELGAAKQQIEDAREQENRLQGELGAAKQQIEEDARRWDKLLEGSGLTQPCPRFGDALTTNPPHTRISIPGLAHQHSVFHRFTPWEGLVGPAFDPTPYGSLIRRVFHDQPPHASERIVHCDHPSLNEEYFEWIDLLEAISAARGKFTMVELGAGYGRWVVAAAAILRRHAPVPYHFVAVEAESAHFAMLRQHFSDNDLHPHQHCLIHAAVSDKHGEVHFTEGHPGEWYGQAILQDPSANFGNWKKARVVKVPSVPLTSILEKLDYVDLLDMDIQGHEAIVCTAAQDSLNKKVQRVHIGTHSPEIERELELVFGKMGWKCYQNYPCNTHTRTPYGVISFVDGVQSWINPKIRNPADLTRSADAKRLEPPPLVRDLFTGTRDLTANADSPFDVFLTPEAHAINRARQEHLASLGLDLASKRVLEVGAGIGLHTPFFLERSCEVVITDGNAQNVEEIGRRLPKSRVVCVDLEDATNLHYLGDFDLVYCYGLLYHLSEPEQTIARLAQVCTGQLLLETMVALGRYPELYRIRDFVSNNQAVSGIGCRPTRLWVIETLRKHFGHGYITHSQPDFPDFQTNWELPETRLGYRAVFVGSKTLLQNPELLAEVPQQQIRHSVTSK